MTEENNLLILPTAIPHTHDAECRPHPAEAAMNGFTTKMDALSIELEVDKKSLVELEGTEEELDKQYATAKANIAREKKIKSEDIQRKARVISGYMKATADMNFISRGLDDVDSEVSVTETNVKKLTTKATKTPRTKKSA